LAQQFHAQGLEVFATSRTLESMEHLSAVGIKTIALDVTDADAIQRVKNEISEIAGGKLDILVNNAGQAYTVAATDYVMSDVRAHFEVNLFAVMAMVQTFVPMLIASGDGRIVQIGSIAAVIPVPFGSAYNASKAALHAYSNTIRVELAPFGIKVITVVTGSVKSNIVKPRTIPEGSLYESLQAQFQERRLRMSQINPMDTTEYAKVVVSEALARSPRALLWSGKQTWPCWLIDTFLPKTTWDVIMSRMYGLKDLAGLVSAKAKDV